MLLNNGLLADKDDLPNWNIKTPIDMIPEKPIDKRVIKILKWMCYFVGCPWPTDPQTYFRSANWYLDYSWSNRRQSIFVFFLTLHIYMNRHVREGFKACPRRWAACKVCAKNFVFNYGWRIEE